MRNTLIALLVVLVGCERPVPNHSLFMRCQDSLDVNNQRQIYYMLRHNWDSAYYYSGKANAYLELECMDK